MTKTSFYIAHCPEMNHDIQAMYKGYRFRIRDILRNDEDEKVFIEYNVSEKDLKSYLRREIGYMTLMRKASSKIKKFTYCKVSMSSSNEFVNMTDSDISHHVEDSFFTEDYCPEGDLNFINHYKSM